MTSTQISLLWVRCRKPARFYDNAPIHINNTQTLARNQIMKFTILVDTHTNEVCWNIWVWNGKIDA